MQIELTFQIVDSTAMEQRFYDPAGKLIEIRMHRAPRKGDMKDQMRETRRIINGSRGGFLGSSLVLDSSGY